MTLSGRIALITGATSGIGLHTALGLARSAPRSTSPAATRNPDAIRAIVPSHVAYWRGRELPEYVGGPFADRTGGLITFAASTLDDARQAVEHDPFVAANLIADSWVKEWRVE